jgi:hypothetical protein
MPSTSMQEFLAAGARGLVEAQLELDERGRDSLDAFGETGVPPTVFTWSRCLLSCPVTVELVPKAKAGERTDANAVPGGFGRILVDFRLLLSPQGGDDPRPAVPEDGLA